jgi:dynein heavy chain, axonemal
LLTPTLFPTHQITTTDIDDLVRESDAPAPRKKPKEWLPDGAWRAACAAAARGGALRELPDALARADGAWRAWYDAPAPERLPLPDLEAKAPVPPFAKAAAVAALRRDRALPALAAFVAAELGPAYADAVPSTVEGALADASPERPVLCLLSRGSDPTAAITDLARRHKVRVHGVSMGQGQEAAARRALTAAAEAGAWALLQNAHLGLGVLADVEALLATPDRLHPAFRLFITTAPCDGFPAGIVQVSWLELGEGD